MRSSGKSRSREPWAKRWRRRAEAKCQARWRKRSRSSWAGSAESEEGFGVGEAVPGVDDGSGETGGTRFAFGVKPNEGGVG